MVLLRGGKGRRVRKNFNGREGGGAAGCYSLVRVFGGGCGVKKEERDGPVEHGEKKAGEKKSMNRGGEGGQGRVTSLSKKKGETPLPPRG